MEIIFFVLRTGRQHNQDRNHQADCYKIDFFIHTSPFHTPGTIFSLPTISPQLGKFKIFLSVEVSKGKRRRSFRIELIDVSYNLHGCNHQPQLSMKAI